MLLVQGKVAEVARKNNKIAAIQVDQVLQKIILIWIQIYWCCVVALADYENLVSQFEEINSNGFK